VAQWRNEGVISWRNGGYSGVMAAWRNGVSVWRNGGNLVAWRAHEIMAMVMAVISNEIAVAALGGVGSSMG